MFGHRPGHAGGPHELAEVRRGGGQPVGVIDGRNGVGEPVDEEPPAAGGLHRLEVAGSRHDEPAGDRETCRGHLAEVGALAADARNVVDAHLFEPGDVGVHGARRGWFGGIDRPLFHGVHDASCGTITARPSNRPARIAS